MARRKRAIRNPVPRNHIRESTGTRLTWMEATATNNGKRSSTGSLVEATAAKRKNTDKYLDEIQISTGIFFLKTRLPHYEKARAS